MSFSTLNGIRAARTAGPTVKQQPQQNMGGVPQQPPQMPPSMGGTPMPPTPYPHQGPGMMGTASSARITGMQAAPGGGMSAPSHAQGGTGVAQYQPRVTLQGPAALQFDPNDPANAALAGYMNGA